MKEYLIYDVGNGEQGSEVRYSYYRYYICKGDNEEEAVQDWINKSPFKAEDCKKHKNTYNICGGRSWLVIIPLKSWSNNKEAPILTW